MRAAASSIGVRNDGSLFYGGYILGTAKPGTLQQDLARLQGGFAPFPKAPHLEPALLELFGEFLRRCQAQGIHVIAVSMPYRPEIVAELEASTQHASWHQFQNAQTAEWIKRFGVEYFNFTRLDSFDGHSDEFVDAFHPSERAVIRVLLKMLENDRVRAWLPRLDRADLTSALARAQNLDAYP